MFNCIKSLAIQLIVALLFLEVSSFVATKLGLFLVNDTPSIFRSDNLSLYDVHDGRTEFHPWGGWRKKNQNIRQISSCFNVEVTSNEVGARDTSFSQQNRGTIFLLGDSFAEGFGVPYNKTSQYILENFLDQNLFNFGMAANIGPLQELMIYEHFRDKYEHNGILVYILPANDFTDNDAKFWKQKGASQRRRHRPYFSETGDPLIPWYFPEAIPKKNNIDFTPSPQDNADRSFIIKLKRFLIDYTWTANALRSASYLLTERQSVNSFYFEASRYQQENFVRAYSELVRIANNKQVVFAIIPSKQDILYHLNSEKSFSYHNQIWFQGLQNLRQKHKVEIIDLMENIPVNYQHLFHSCDPHWSIKGNEWAARVIFDTLKRQGVQF